MALSANESAEMSDDKTYYQQIKMHTDNFIVIIYNDNDNGNNNKKWIALATPLTSSWINKKWRHAKTDATQNDNNNNINETKGRMANN